MLNAWEGPIALLDTETSDRRVLSSTQRVPVVDETPLRLLESSGVTYGGKVLSTHVRDIELWATGITNHPMFSILKEVGKIPCGVDLKPLLGTDVLYASGVMMILKWEIATITAYLDGTVPAFGKRTFIQLKESE